MEVDFQSWSLVVGLGRISMLSCLAASSAMACLKQDRYCQITDALIPNPLLLYGDLEKSYLIVQVPCGEDIAHAARLSLSTMSHNGMFYLTESDSC